MREMISVLDGLLRPVFCVFCVIIVRSWCRFGIWFVCVVVSGVRVVELLRCAVLLLGECLKKLGSMFESDECWESKGLRLSDRRV